MCWWGVALLFSAAAMATGEHCPIGFYRVTAVINCLLTLGHIAAAPGSSLAMATGGLPNRIL